MQNKVQRAKATTLINLWNFYPQGSIEMYLSSFWRQRWGLIFSQKAKEQCSQANQLQWVRFLFQYRGKAFKTLELGFQWTFPKNFKKQKWFGRRNASNATEHLQAFGTVTQPHGKWKRTGNRGYLCPYSFIIRDHLKKKHSGIFEVSWRVTYLMEDSVRAQMIPLLNSQLRLRKSIHMGRLQTWSNALIKIIPEEKNYGISAWFLCFPPLWQCLCQCRVWERATKAAENMLHSGNASLSWAAVLWAGAETVYFVIMPLRCLVCPCAQPRGRGPSTLPKYILGSW